MKRREFIRTAALAAGGSLLAARVSFARPDSGDGSRLVVVMMRGALDGLAAVPPFGDGDYARIRRELAIPPPGQPGGALPLNSVFGLHPSLMFLHEAFGAQELVVVHACASPYRERSHFDGQDVLESGSVHPHAVQTGWLNRALVSLQSAGSRPSRELGVALGQNVPLLMRGAAPVTSWSSSKLATLDEDTLDRIMDLYAADPLLSARFADALAADAIASAPKPDPEMHEPASGSSSLLQRAKLAKYTEVVRAAAGFLRREDGPRVAVFDTTGWDTHANEGNANGQLAGRLSALDDGLRSLKDELGPVWKNTTVVLATEFGRTAATNGTRGTDHGTATAAFVLGGAVQGGRVVADWPGLSGRSLYQGRDLAPTTDLRSVLKGVLSDHLRIANRVLESSVFPDSAAAKPLQGLIRA